LSFHCLSPLGYFYHVLLGNRLDGFRATDVNPSP
jgi:hypothetical protein